MTIEETKISRELTTQLLHLAQISPTEEICGLIGGNDGKARHCYPVKNIDSQPQRKFSMDPEQQISAMTKMRKRNEHLFAIYHSHPDSPAVPSQTDIELAAYPEALYLIISLNIKGVLELRGFKLNQGVVTEIPLALEH